MCEKNCQHQPSEDCLCYSVCGECREDLDSTDICIDCGGTVEE